MTLQQLTLLIDVFTCTVFDKCDLPQENQPSSHLIMIVEIPVLKFLIGITSFFHVRLTISGRTGHNGLLVFL